MEFLTSLISFGSIASWIVAPFMGIMLLIDGVIYELVSYAFNLFMLMCQLDFSSLFGIVTPIVDRLKAVVMVLVVFKLGMSFIKWMIEPESAPKEGSKLVVNIFITAMFLIGYNFVFDLFNEIGMLIMGAPEGRDFVVLNQVADISGGDEGLIMRFIFGEGAQVENIGDYLAYESVKIFVHDIDNPEESPTVRDTICSEEKCTFTKLVLLTSKLDKTVEYKFLISGLVGIYIIYSIVKVAIEIGVRMFKLLILQILAPIAIITIIDGGIKSSTFQTFYKKYISVYIEAFTRMASMLLIMVFIAKFFTNLDSFFGPISDTDAGLMTKLLLTVLVVVAAFKIGGSIPKFIDEALGTHMSGGDKKGGFGKFATGLVGSALGLAGGIGAGVAAGAGGLGIAMNAASGAFNGFNSASKGNNIADFFKNTSATTKANRERAQKIARMGGGGQYALHGVENALGVTQRRQSQLQRQADNAKALENMMEARKNAAKNYKNLYGVSYGDEEAYAEKMLEYDQTYTNMRTAFASSEDSYKSNLAAANTDYQAKNSAYLAAERKRADAEAKLSNGSITQAEYNRFNTAAKEAERKLTEADNKRKSIYNARQAEEKRLEKCKESRKELYRNEHHNFIMTSSDINADSSVQNTTKEYDRRAESKYKSENLGSKAELKEAQTHYANAQANINNTATMQREQRPGRY